MAARHLMARAILGYEVARTVRQLRNKIAAKRFGLLICGEVNIGATASLQLLISLIRLDALAYFQKSDVFSCRRSVH